MPGQPLNSTISVYRRVRAYRNQRRHETVEALTKKQRPLIMSVPNQETLTVIATRDTAVKDFSPWGRDGQPVVLAPRATKTFGEAQEGITGVDFFVEVGNDRMLQNTSDALDNDLFQDLRDL